MSGISSASASPASTVSVGTSLAPITFPGIASGIDYNSIVNKLTALTLAPNKQYNNQVTQLNAKNAELIKINGLFASVQSALTSLSDPSTFNAYTGKSSDPNDASLTQLPGGAVTAGTYAIESTQLATSTQVTGGASAGVTVNSNTALISAGTSITPTNGTGGQAGQITVDGVPVSYDVNSQSLNTIVANIYAAVHAVDAGFTISASANGALTIASSDQQISLGSPADKGNLAQVLKLDIAQVQNGVGSGTVTSAGPVGGINAGDSLNAAGSAGFATAVTSGTFTINGLKISVDALNDSVASVVAKINSSTAGVVAAFNLVTDTFSLTNKGTGAASIVIGASGDTSNFLNATELTAATGSSSSVGKQAYVAVLTASGALQTAYSNSNAVDGAIAGTAINVTGTTSTPFSITVSQNSSVAVVAIQNFVSAYNAALNEIGTASAPPVVQQSSSSATSTQSTSSLLATGGVLYGDETVSALSAHLTQLVSGLSYNGNTSYNSLASIGLALDSSHTVYTSNTNAQGGTVDKTVSGTVATTTADGTSGQFAPLDVAAFTAALQADPTTVASLFTSTSGLANQLGSYLTAVTGAPTNLVGGLSGAIPTVSLLQNDENSTTAEIQTLNQSVHAVTDKANAQADQLRKDFTASEALIAKYQSEQTYANQLSSSSA